MKQYTVEYRDWDPMEQDVTVIQQKVLAETAHEAIGIAWPLMKKEVEQLDGTIDELDAWTYIEAESSRDRLAYLIFQAMTLGNRGGWVALSDKEAYYRAADAMILRFNL